MVCIVVTDARRVLLVCSSFNLCTLCGMSYYKIHGCASRQEGVSLLFGDCCAPYWVGASGDKTLLSLELPSTQSTGRVPACREGQDLQLQKGVERLEKMKRGGEGRCLLEAQGRTRSSFRADCKEETFLEMQRWLCMVCLTQEATREELGCKTQQERLPKPTECAREGSGLCVQRWSRVSSNIFVH